MQNDLIFRDDVLEYAEMLRVPMEHESYNDCRAVSVNDILAVPAVDAEVVRHGRWIIEWQTTIDYCTGEYDEEPIAICPFCEYREYGSAYDDYWGRPSNYCPNCGAKMDADKNDIQRV